MHMYGYVCTYMTGKSIGRTSREPRISRSSHHDVVGKQLKYQGAKKNQLFQKVQKTDVPMRYGFAAAILSLWQTTMTASVTKLLLTIQVKLTAVVVAPDVLFFIIIFLVG